MSKAYLIAFVDIDDFETLKKDYIVPSVSITFAHKGKLLAASNPNEVVVKEGNLPAGWTILLEFPSMHYAEAFYSDPKYINLIKIRESLGTSSLAYFPQGSAPNRLKRVIIKIALMLGLK